QQHAPGVQISPSPSPPKTPIEASNDVSPEPPNPPAGIDPTNLHVWIRVNTRPVAEELYKNSKGFDHAKLRKLVGEIGGTHADVVIGNKGNGWYEYGMTLEHGDHWQESTNNLKGQRLKVYIIPLRRHSLLKWTFIGSLGGVTYHTKYWNCMTWSLKFVERIKPLMAMYEEQSRTLCTRFCRIPTKKAVMAKLWQWFPQEAKQK
ncbi:hypothetical protein PspLS_08738, partial [Pyricularia sp. CBS 133598]